MCSESHKGSDAILLQRKCLDFSIDNTFSSCITPLMERVCLSYHALNGWLFKEVHCDCSTVHSAHIQYFHKHTYSTHTFIIHHTDRWSGLTGFGGFSAPLLLPMASSSTSRFQFSSFTPTIPNLKNPSLHFRWSTLALRLNNTLYHTLTSDTQPSHSTSLFTTPLQPARFYQSNHKCRDGSPNASQLA